MLLKIIILSAFVYLFKTYYLLDSAQNLFNPIKTFEVCYCTHFITEKTKVNSLIAMLMTGNPDLFPGIGIYLLRGKAIYLILSILSSNTK